MYLDCLFVHATMFLAWMTCFSLSAFVVPCAKASCGYLTTVLVAQPDLAASTSLQHQVPCQLPFLNCHLVSVLLADIASNKTHLTVRTL